MAEVTVLKALTNYFNVDEGKRSLPQWRDEMAALKPEEKRELAEGVVAITGDKLLIQ